jgi:hypothetical protein
MRRTAALICILSLAPGIVFAAELRGAWHATVDGDRIHLNLLRDGSDSGRSFSRSEFPLSDAQINATSETPVSFTLARDAGSIAMTGSFQSGEGVGRFTFTPNPSYGQTLRALGVGIDEELTDEHLFSLAMMDVTTAFIRDMQALGYRESLSQYTAFRIHGVNAPFIRAMKALGYTPSADELVTFRIHGVTSDFVRELRDLGYAGLSSDQLVAMRIHGVSTEFIRDLKGAGYQNVPVEKLIEMRVHGIDADFLRKAQ